MFQREFKTIFKNLYQFIILILVKTSVSNAKSHHKRECSISNRKAQTVKAISMHSAGQYVLIFLKACKDLEYSSFINTRHDEG